jgi:phage/plasmid-like protein (TIGR03299 family)
MNSNLHSLTSKSSRSYQPLSGDYQFLNSRGIASELDDSLDIYQALSKAGLDFEVNTKDLYTVSPVEGSPYEMADPKPIEGFKATYRTDTNEVLGVVSDRYKVIQQSEAFEFVDILRENNVQMTLDSAGIYGNGSYCWVSAKLPEQEIVRIDGTEDIITPYMFFSNGHTGYHATTMSLLQNRVWCCNQVQSIINGIPNQFKTKHRGDYKASLRDAQNTMALSEKYFEESLGLMQRMAKKEMSLTSFNTFAPEYMNLVKGKIDTMPNKKSYSQNHESRQRTIAELTSYFTGGKGNTGETVWDAYNSVTEWIDHKVERMKTAKNLRKRYETSMRNSIDGSGKRQRQAAANLLIKRYMN